LLLIFDLDGTLIYSSEDLAISVNATLRHFGRGELDRETIQSYVGSGAPALVRRAFGSDVTEATLEDGLAFFLSFYRAHALEHTRLYPGIREAVDELAQKHSLAVLTNKPERISTDIIAFLKLTRQFPRVVGGDRFPAKKPDPAGLRALMQDTNTKAEETVMIGDTDIDVQTARNAGVRSCGVTWGFRPESFMNVPPNLLVHTPGELAQRIVLEGD
jgi:phosphoglycolate phosphatase